MKTDTTRIICQRTFSCDGSGEYHGYLCERGGRIFPAFTHGQMHECARVQGEFANAFGHDVYATLENHGAYWLEMYGDDVADVIAPMYADGLALYALGYATQWPWD